jgi:hypothetical protein
VSRAILSIEVQSNIERFRIDSGDTHQILQPRVHREFSAALRNAAAWFSSYDHAAAGDSFGMLRKVLRTGATHHVISCHLQTTKPPGISGGSYRSSALLGVLVYEAHGSVCTTMP